MSEERSQSGSNSEIPEVSSLFAPYSDDIAGCIKRVRESAPPLFIVVAGSIFVEDWTRIMS